MRRRCEGKEGGCPVLTMIRSAAGVAGDADPQGMAPVGREGMERLARALQEDFVGYRCHAMQVIMGMPGVPPLGLVCLGVESGDNLRILLNAEDVDRLVIALHEMQKMMQATKGQVH